MPVVSLRLGIKSYRTIPYYIGSVLTDHDCPWNDLLVLGVALDPVVEGDGVHDVQQLTLVLVDALHLLADQSNQSN